MKTSNLFTPNWSEVTGGERNEIVFERLNKTYGAYQIRSDYDNTLAKAFAGTGFFIILLSALFFLTRSEPKQELKLPDTDVNSEKIFYPKIEFPKPIEQPKTSASSAPTKSLTDPVITDNTVTQTNIPQDNSNHIQGTGITSDSSNHQTIIGDSDPPLPPDTGVVEIGGVDKLPMFPGGDDELYHFLKSNTRIPEVIREIGNIKEKVGVSFTIEKDGSISGIALVHDGCQYPQLNNEAVRVVKKMPTWAPGEQHGKPVRVRLILPMRFEVK